VKSRYCRVMVKWDLPESQLTVTPFHRTWTVGNLRHRWGLHWRQIHCVEGRIRVRCAHRRSKWEIPAKFCGERENHAANNPDHPVSAFPFGRVAQLAVQCKLGILSEWRIRLSLDHCNHLDRLRHCINIIVVDIPTPAPLSNSTPRLVGDSGILCIWPHNGMVRRRNFVTV
jgi:hypothetical protein